MKAVTIGLMITLISSTVYPSRRGPAQVFTRVETAYQLLKKSEYQKTIEELEPNIQNLTYNETIILSEAYKKTNEYQKQINLIKPLAKTYPSNWKLLLELGKSYLNESKRLSERRPEQSKYFEALGVETLTQGQKTFTKVESFYASLINFYEEHEEGYEARLFLLLAVKYFGEKVDYVRSLCRWFSHDSYIKQTQKWCKKAMSKDPKDSESYYLLTKSFIDSDDVGKYKKNLAKGTKTFPQSFLINYQYGIIFFKEKNYAAAIPFLESALSIEENAEASLFLARAYFETNKLDLSLDYFNQSCKIPGQQKSDILYFYQTSFKKLKKRNPFVEKFKQGFQECKLQISLSSKIK